MKDIFFQEKSKEILLTLYNNDSINISSVSRKIRGTYAHIFNLIKEMESGKIIESEKIGRSKNLRLTRKGMALAKLLDEFTEVLSDLKEITEPSEKNKKVETKNKLKNIKIFNYSTALDNVFNEIKSNGNSKKNYPKYARILGRYKSLLKKVRPKNKDDKELKRGLLEKIEKFGILIRPEG